jgi:exo-1,4-beta-D-glucosaminidase
LHAIYAYDTHTITVDNLGAGNADNLSVQARVLDIAGNVLDDRSRGGLSLASQEVRNRVLTLRIPATTQPPAPGKTFFVELILRHNDHVVDRNVYWVSTQEDIVDWAATLGKPQATMAQYADLTDLDKLAPSTVNMTAMTSAVRGPEGDTATTITITNTSRTSAVAFFLRADIRRGTARGAELAGDNQVRRALWTDNDITLWPGESQVITATYRAQDLNGAEPVVSLFGWNTRRMLLAAPRHD